MNKTTNIRLSEQEKESLEKIAKDLGYCYGEKGSIGKMLKGLLAGDIIIIPKKYLPTP